MTTEPHPPPMFDADRRERTLEAMRRAAAGRRARSSASRIGLGIAVLSIAATLAWWLLAPKHSTITSPTPLATQSSPPQPTPTASSPNASQGTSSRSAIMMIQSDPSRIASMSITGDARNVITLRTDADLQLALRESGSNLVAARVEGKLVLISR